MEILENKDFGNASVGTGEIVVYQPDEITKLEVRVNEETVWLTQGQMAELFQTSPQNVTIHIRNIYDEGELQKNPTCKEYLQVKQEGSKTVRRRQKIYNLDVIISVGYRVKSIRGTQFRQWANGVLKAYLIKDAARATVRVITHETPGALPIETKYETLAFDGTLSRLQVTLLTGRTHQIRAHMAFLSHPLLGDDKYGDRNFNKRMKTTALHLCAVRLTLHLSVCLSYLDGRTFSIQPPF